MRNLWYVIKWNTATVRTHQNTVGGIFNLSQRSVATPGEVAVFLPYNGIQYMIERFIRKLRILRIILKIGSHLPKLIVWWKHRVRFFWTHGVPCRLIFLLTVNEPNCWHWRFHVDLLCQWADRDLCTTPKCWRTLRLLKVSGSPYSAVHSLAYKKSNACECDRSRKGFHSSRPLQVVITTNHRTMNIIGP